jgi:hypothetical protein
MVVQAKRRDYGRTESFSAAMFDGRGFRRSRQPCQYINLIHEISPFTDLLRLSDTGNVINFSARPSSAPSLKNWPVSASNIQPLGLIIPIAAREAESALAVPGVYAAGAGVVDYTVQGVRAFSETIDTVHYVGSVRDAGAVGAAVDGDTDREFCSFRWLPPAVGSTSIQAAIELWISFRRSTFLSTPT